MQNKSFGTHLEYIILEEKPKPAPAGFFSESILFPSPESCCFVGRQCGTEAWFGANSNLNQRKIESFGGGQKSLQS